MTVIAIESSTLRPSVAAWHRGRCIQAWLSSEKSHAADLLPTVASLLTQLDRQPGDIERVVVGRGPGSYTGLRVAAATAIGVARGTSASIAGISSFEALAWRELAPGERCVVLVDARAHEAYWAILARGANDVLVETAPSVAHVEDVPALLPRNLPIFSHAGIELSVPLDDAQRRMVRIDAVPQASALLELSLERGERCDPDIEPLYLRAFAAKPRRA
ncbi:MAG: tRNA (adenosine(37)-N6)-threonylcarbamoyltransferase complex dimerization subunit type 1 TsaB [Planctomycetes bacterium]|nr:tRNA (adenosine(37)-N6)-threonylcarbamoyltransferase complex dimerization subunit type 1 TsaB [Planctomycetota bacterium]